jgi:hypothetical protein
MKKLFIEIAWSLCVGFEVWMPWRQWYMLSIGIKITEYKRWIQYDQEEEMKIEFLCRTQVIHALAYVLRKVVSRSREFVYKRRIQDMALCRGHDGLMSWDMIDLRPRACNQMKNSLCTSKYCLRAWEDTRLTKTKIKDWILDSSIHEAWEMCHMGSIGLVVCQLCFAK